MKPHPISVVIPTFLRETVLIETLSHVIKLRPSELILCDQSPTHEEATKCALDEMQKGEEIQLFQISQPNIARAMNLGISVAKEDIVLFLDDDLIPSPGLLAAHARAHAAHSEAWAVVGQVLQPGEEPVPMRDGDAFCFNSDQPTWVKKAMAGNLSVKRARALAIGGFDENFVQAAYCFETEFAERVYQSGGKVFFEPKASIRHLRAERGGTRAHGHHLTTASPGHSVGAYYHMFLKSGVLFAIPGVIHRVIRSVATRHHFKKPWWIPVTILGELRGLILAMRLFRTGPKLLKS